MMFLKESFKNTLKKSWLKYSESKITVLGLVIVVGFVLLACVGEYVVPYPQHIGSFVDFANASQPPSLRHPFGTDLIGRDILSRIVGSFRNTLLMGVIVLCVSAPVGFIVGVVAGYNKGKLIDTVLMRLTDIFLALPPLVLALAVASVLEPNMINSMLAITVMWWPWYARLSYGVASSLRTENYIVYAELTGAGTFHILFREILPNCLSSLLTKMTLDMGYVIIMGATLSYAGLGEQAPKPALGSMISQGVKYMPGQWWFTVFPALAIIVIILGFNLFGDGISNMLGADES
ncbi:MAG: ABC transporter permease [Synergistaceae bacterium]|jgi:peptide/nickel transport system permease protein|nr:ABC transporter permease [Synergistaceae bacterium]